MALETNYFKTNFQLENEYSFELLSSTTDEMGNSHYRYVQTYDGIAIEAGVTYDKMPLKGQDWWFGVTPPDLSLSARVRSADWIYTYLHSFYKDPSHKLGTNNLLMPNSSMPNPFGGMQGDQVLKISLDG